MAAPALSPSQIDQWRTCNRKWAWRYLAKIQAPKHPSAQVGTRVHSILEDYLRHGTAPDREETLTIGDRRYWPGQIASAILRHLPRPGTVEVERGFSIQLEGIHYRGFIDWLGREDGIPVIGDHKTTASLRYAKTPQDLKENEQAIIYGAFGLDHFGSDKVRLQWTYGQTKGKTSSRAVCLDLREDQINRGFESVILPASRDILAAYRERPDPKSLPPNTSACDMYGGCPYKGNCNLTASEKMRAFMANSAILEKIRQKKAAQAAAAAGATETPKEEPVRETPKTPLTEKIKSQAGEINPPGEAAPEAAPEPPAAEAQAAPPKTKKKAPTRTSGGGKVNEFVLFVDCAPQGDRFRAIPLHDLTGPAADAVQEDQGVPHYGLIEFGKGPAALAAQLRANLQAAPLGEDVAVLTTLRTPEGQATFSALAELASYVVYSL